MAKTIVRRGGGVCLSEAVVARKRWRRRATETLKQAAGGSIVASEAHHKAGVLVWRRSKPHHLALRAMHLAIATVKRPAWSGEVECLSDAVATQKRRRLASVHRCARK